MVRHRIPEKLVDAVMGLRTETVPGFGDVGETELNLRRVVAGPDVEAAEWTLGTFRSRPCREITNFLQVSLQCVVRLCVSVFAV